MERASSPRNSCRTLVDGDVAPVIRERVALGERSPASVTASTSSAIPRAHALLDALARAGASEKLTKEIPERIAEATGEFVNIDYALAVLVHTLGLPPGNELVLFAMARTVGWIAHACEQLRHGGLIRPRARYIGPAPGRSAAFNKPKPTIHRCISGSLRAAAVAGSIAPPPLRRRMVQTASATISAPPITSGIQ